jgi:hypothetical protein
MYWNIFDTLCWSAKRTARSTSRSALILASISIRSLLSSSSWAYNISPQCYNNAKIRYITQWMTSYRNTNLEFLDVMLWAVMSRSSHAPCSQLRHGGSGGRIDYPVGNPSTPMPLASSDPHEDISVDVLSSRIVIWPMDLLCHGSCNTLNFGV